MTATSNKLSLVAIALLMLMITPVRAQQDPLDLGGQDSLYLVLSQPQLGFDDTTLSVELYLSNDAQPVVGLSAGWEWDNTLLRLDSARLAASAGPLCGFFNFLYYKDDLDSSNAYGRVQCALMSAPGEQQLASGTPRLVATYYFHLLAWQPGGEVCFEQVTFNRLALVDPDDGEYTPLWRGLACQQAGADSDGDGRGDPWDNCPGDYNPDQADMDNDDLGNVCDPEADGDGIDDAIDNCLLLYNPLQEDDDEDGIGNPCDNTCCVGRVGDANGNDDEEPTLSDISAIISMLFIDLQPVGCLAEADVNQSGGNLPTAEDISLGDISILIDYLFITGPELGLPDCL